MTDRPVITVHYAQSLDGRLATCLGESHWIGGESALRFAHVLRANHDAVLVGVGTVLADDPRLTVRLVRGRSPRRIVLDSSLRLPLEAHVLTDGDAATLIATTPRATDERVAAVRAHKVEVLVTREACDGRVDLTDLLQKLASVGVRSLLVEGGAAVITSLLRQGLVDRVTVCVAPTIIGTGIEAVGDLGTRHLVDALTFADSRFFPLGDDAIFDGWIRRPDSAPPGPKRDEQLATLG